MSYNIEEMISSGKMVNFQYYRKGDMRDKTDRGFRLTAKLSPGRDDV